MQQLTLIDSIQPVYDAMAARAAKVHADVNQMYGDKPYSYHLFSVAEKTALLIDTMYPDIEEDKNIITVILFGALFHDSIEDARLSYNDVHKIALEFMGEPYATASTEIVYALTNEKGRTRSERANEKYYDGIVNTPYAPMVKLADRIANMANSKAEGHSMYSKYVSEWPHFLSCLKIKPEIASKISSLI